MATSILPARAPMSAMAGATNPTIISGMQKPRNSPNMELNVAIVLAAHSGAIHPTPIPRAMAIRILGSNPSFSFFDGDCVSGRGVAVMVKIKFKEKNNRIAFHIAIQMRTAGQS